MLIKMNASPIIVIKIGGHAMDDQTLLSGLINDLEKSYHAGVQIVVVHGGGPCISGLLKRLNLKSGFKNGLRITDNAILEAAEMALCGTVNKDLVRRFLQNGLPAAGISGEDAGLLKGETIDPELGRVGAITAVRPQILTTLLDSKYIPVVAPIALDSGFQPLNVNADTAAGAIAAALQADYFILVSDVPGILDADKNVIPVINAQKISEMVNSQLITDGMIPKTECCLASLKTGCKAALILNGKEKHSLNRFMEKGENLGTLIES